MAGKKYPVYLLILLAAVVLAVVYKMYDPFDFVFFPKCPFRELTGWECPGCGSQRALHHLLNGNVGGAFRANALLVVAIPYVIAGIAIEQVKSPGPRLLVLRKALYGKWAIMVVLTLILGFFLLRNVAR